MPSSIKSFSLDSTFELSSDFFTVVAVNGVDFFLNASPDDRVSISAGLKTAGGENQIISFLEDGVVDEYELTITPNSIEGALRGRDQISKLLDRLLDFIFIRAEYETLVDGVSIRRNLLPRIEAEVEAAKEEVGEANVFVGEFTAKEIAQRICASVNLELSWEVRDYTLQRTFRTRRAIDSLLELVDPWVQVDPYRADIFLHGKTVIIRHRQLPDRPLVPDHTMTLREMRQSSLILRKRRPRKVRKLRLNGKLVPAKGTGPDELGFLIVGPSESYDWVKQEALSRDANGNPVRTVTTSLIKSPGQLLVQQVKSTFAPHLVARDTIRNTWEASPQGDRLRESVVLNERELPGRFGPIFLDAARITKRLSYDVQGFLVRDVEVTETREETAFGISSLVQSRMVLKYLNDLGPLLSEQITEVYQSTFGSAAIPGGGWELVSRDSQVQGGHRAGGPGRGIPVGVRKVGDEGASATLEHLEKKETLSEDPNGIDVFYFNENLGEEDLDFLVGLFKAANNLSFEYELAFDGVSVPWLQRGTVLRVEDVKSDDGTEILLPLVIITEVRTQYDESNRMSFTTNVRAFGWE